MNISPAPSGIFGRPTRSNNFLFFIVQCSFFCCDDRGNRNNTMCRVSCRHLFFGGGLPLPSPKIQFFPSFLLLFLNAHLLICLLQGISTVAQYPLLKAPPQKKVSPPKLRFVFHNIYQSCVTRRSATGNWSLPSGAFRLAHNI